MDQVKPERRVSSRVLDQLADPISLTVVVVAPLFWLARRLGLVANQPIWLILLFLVGSWLASNTVSALWAGVRSGWRLWARIAIQLAGINIVIYAVGWGPTLAIGLVFGAMDAIRESGPSAVFPASVCSVVALGLGELAIGTGLSPSLIRRPLVHGLAMFAALGVTFTIMLYGRAKKETEEAARELRQSEERSKALVQHASDIIMVIGFDAMVLYASPALEEALGYAIADIVGHPGLALAHEEDVAKLRESLDDVATDGNTTRAEVRMRHVDGSWRWFEVIVTNLFDNPSVNGWVANLRDVTERKRSEAALLEAQEAFRHAFDDAPIGMALVGLDGNIRRANRSLAQLLGWTEQELQGVAVSELTHPEDRALSLESLGRLQAQGVQSYRLEKRYMRADGAQVWVALSVSMVNDREGQPLYAISQMEDITERRALSDQLAHEAAHDPLTGLPNRAGFSEQVAIALDQARQDRQRIAVLFIDLDHFKMVNDGLGHAAGDELLVAIAERLRRALRPHDTLARFGGDEFVVLCTGVTGENGALELARRLGDTIAQPTPLDHGEVFVTASVGIALSGLDDDTSETLLRKADAAMYHAKSEGRARIEVFESANADLAVTLLKTGNDLHRALERQELELHYQPIVDLGSGRVDGFEALLRWNHAERGLLMPADFITLAEETGLIVTIGAWALETACRQTVRWQTIRDREQPSLPSLTINVNLSPRQVTDRGLARTVAQIISRTGIRPSSICLEITENSLMQNAESVITTLEVLHTQGVNLSIDDFGTGYSSLSYLKRFPVASLKIDQSFVDGLGIDPDDSSIVDAIITLAHALGLTAVAEGLQTPQQLEALRTMGCDYAQGYLLGHPLPASIIGDHPADDLTTWQATPNGGWAPTG